MTVRLRRPFGGQVVFRRRAESPRGALIGNPPFLNTDAAISPRGIG
jgi:hypothetical protein